MNLEIKSYKSIYSEVQKNIQRISKIPSIRPVDGGYLNSTFGYRIDPIDNVKRFHHGQDITVKSGSPIFAPADGEVKRAYYVWRIWKPYKNRSWSWLYHAICSFIKIES